MFFLSLLKVSIRASIKQKGAFVCDLLLMIFNNLIFIALWWIFFERFKEIGHWQMADMIALNAVGLGAYGFMRVFFGGVITLSKTILNGSLDIFLTQPKNVLLHILMSTSYPKGFGHLLSAFILIAIGNLYSHIGSILIGIITGALVFTSIAVVAHSSVFFLKNVEIVAKKYCESIYLFSLYPTNIYSDMLQIMMFTLVPAGVITYLPVELIRAFSYEKLIYLILISALFVLLAFAFFGLGLRRYESGNQFSIKT